MATSSTSEASSSYNRKRRNLLKGTSAADKQESAERNQRKSDREKRSTSREERIASRERRQRITGPAKKVVGKTTEGTGSSTALGLGVAGVAALFITAGILHKKLGEVLEGDTGETAKQEGEKAEKEITPTEEATRSDTYEHAPEKTAPNPFTIGPSLNSQQELTSRLQKALTYWDKQLEPLVKGGKLSYKEAQKRFGETYPHYARETIELRELTERLKREGKIR